jgi:DNA repair protein RadC
LVRDLPVTERPSYRLGQAGAAALSSTELLALVLGTPDAYDLATELLVAFGSLDRLMLATAVELKGVRGVGEATAARLLAALEIGRRTLPAYNPDKVRVDSPAAAASVLIPLIGHLPQEHVVSILLDTRNQVIAVPTIFKGNLNTAVVTAREIYRTAVRHNAAAFILSHNHPSGDPSPSPDDVRVTQQIVQAGNLMDIACVDHIIIGGSQFVSLKERGLGF